MEKKYRTQLTLLKIILFIIFAVLGIVGFLLVETDKDPQGVIGIVMMFIAVIVLIFAISFTVSLGVKVFTYKDYRICTVRGMFTDRLIVNDEEMDHATSPVGFSWVLPLKGVLPTGEMIDAQIAPMWNGAFVYVNGQKIGKAR